MFDFEISDKLLMRDSSYVNGAWIGSDTGESLPVTDPATGEAIGQIACLSAAQSTEAVDHADTAFAS